MSMSAPPVLPVKNAPPTVPLPSSESTTQSQNSTATPALRSFINSIYDSARNGLAQRRPWLELVDRSAFSRPESLSDATVRVRKNYSYFRVNYISLVALVVAFSLLSHPISLLILTGLLAAWLFLHIFRPSDQPLIILGRPFSDTETIGLLVLLSVVVVFLTSVGSVLISALMVGIAVMVAHGAFRVPEDLFLDEQSAPTTGFLSFLGNTASNAAAATVVATRV